MTAMAVPTSLPLPLPSVKASLLSSAAEAANSAAALVTASSPVERISKIPTSPVSVSEPAGRNQPKKALQSEHKPSATVKTVGRQGPND